MSLLIQFDKIPPYCSDIIAFEGVYGEKRALFKGVVYAANPRAVAVKNAVRIFVSCAVGYFQEIFKPENVKKMNFCYIIAEKWSIFPRTRQNIKNDYFFDTNMH